MEEIILDCRMEYKEYFGNMGGEQKVLENGENIFKRRLNIIVSVLYFLAINFPSLL